jgi:ankyrin repeat protein
VLEARRLHAFSSELQVPLLHAIFLHGHENHSKPASSIDMLISAGADVNCTSTGLRGNTNTALMCSSNNCCCMEPLRTLLQAGAAVHKSTGEGVTAVMVAARRGNLEAVQVLLEHGADPFAVDNDGCDSVYKAAGSGDLELLKLLMDMRDSRDAAASEAASSSSPPLLAAASYGQLQCAEWLLVRSDVQINATDSTSWTALHCAAANCSGEDWCDRSLMFELLLSHGADVHACIGDGSNALSILTSTNGSIQCAKVLLAAGWARRTASGQYRHW